MITKVTQGIAVSVDTRYEEGQSQPSGKYFLFSYRISIENHSSDTVQLRRRLWRITDSTGEYREVEGPGVVGEQPIIAPGEKYTYQSSCHFSTEIGRMSGDYQMERLSDRETFYVEIPEFLMEVPSRLN